MDMLTYPSGEIDKARFRNSMSRLGASVSVVTTLVNGKRYGFTASAVCSVSDTPATLLVCLNRASSCFPAFAKSTHFCVNTLLPGQEDIADRFGAKLPQNQRFEQGEWRQGSTGSPILLGACVSFECLLSTAVDEASHRVMFGQVLDIHEAGDQAAMLYCLRRYMRI